MICPNKSSEEWKSLVESVKKEFNVDDKTASDLSTLSFYRKGDIPTPEEASRIISETATFTRAKTIKQSIKDLFSKILKRKPEDVGYRMGMAEIKKKMADIEEKRKEFTKRLSEYLKTNEKLRGKLSDKQIDAITRKANKIGVSEKAFAKFTEYVDKVVANENYEQDLRDVNKLQDKVKKTFAEFDEFVKRVKKVNPEDLTQESLNKLKTLLQDYTDSQKPVTSKEYKPMEREAAYKTLSELEKEISDKRVREIQEAYDVQGFTEEEANLLKDFMESEDQDVFYENLDEAKQKEILYNLQKVADYSILGLQEFLPENETYYKETFGDRYYDWLKEISEVNIGLITNPKDIAIIIKSVDNSIINKSISNTGNAHSIVKAYEGLPLLKQRTAGLVKSTLGVFSKAYYDTPIILKRIFGDRTVAAAIRLYTGYDEVINASSSAEVLVFKAKEEWNKFLKANNIKVGAEEDVAMGVFARLNDVRKGMETEDFLNEKSRLEQSIERYKNSGNTEQIRLSELLDAIYNESIKDANTHEEFVRNFEASHADEVKAVKWASENIWKKYGKDFKNHAEANLNETFDGDLRDNYSPISYTRVKADVQMGEPEGSEFVFKVSSPTPKETGRSKARILEGKLPKDGAVDYQFEYKTFKNFQDIKFEMDSYHGKMIGAKMSKLDGFDSIFGGSENAKYFSNTYDSQYRTLRFGRKNADVLNKSYVIAVSRVLKNIGSAIGLARISQIFSQATPGINTFFQVPKYMFDVLSTKGLADVELLNMSSISARGIELGSIGRGEGTEALVNTKLKRGFAAFADKIGRFTGKAREVVLKPLSGTDVLMAKKSFLAYYLDYMNNVKGIKVEAKDLPTEHLKMDAARKEAISYAQQAVDETQGVSNRVLLSEFKKNENGGVAGEVLKNIVMPFNNFASNSRARILEDVRKTIYGNDVQRAEALRDIRGTVAEATAFSAINAFVVTGMLRYGLKSVMASAFDLEEDDKSLPEVLSNNFKAFYTGLVRELTISGFGGEAETAGVEVANYFAYNFKKLMDDEFDESYTDWLKDDPMFRPQFQPPSSNKVEQIINNLGIYGIAARTGMQTYEDIQAGVTGTAKNRYSFNRIKEGEDKIVGTQYNIEEQVELTDEDKRFFMFTGILEGMSMLGLGEQDIIRAAQARKAQSLRQYK